MTLVRRFLAILLSNKIIQITMLSMIVLSGMLLFNFDLLGASPLSERRSTIFNDGSIIAHNLKGDPNSGRLVMNLTLESFRGNTGKLSEEFIFAVRVETVKLGTRCTKDLFTHYPNEPSSRSIYTRSLIPVDLKYSIADSYDSGKQPCYQIFLKSIDDLIWQKVYFKRGTLPQIKQIGEPRDVVDNLLFNHQVSKVGENQIRARLRVTSRDGQFGWLPSRIPSVINVKILNSRASCNVHAFTDDTDPDNNSSYDLQYIEQAGRFLRGFIVNLKPQSQYLCYQIYLDHDRDNKDWLSRYTSTAELPWTWGSGSTINRDLVFFSHEFTRYSLSLRLDAYEGQSGALPHEMSYSVRMKSVHWRSECSGRDFVVPGVDYIDKTGTIGVTPVDLLTKQLRRDLSDYSGKYACFQIKLRQASLPPHIPATQIYYYASTEKVEYKGPLFGHSATIYQYGTHLTLNLLEYKAADEANLSPEIRDIYMTPVSQPEDCERRIFQYGAGDSVESTAVFKQVGVIDAMPAKFLVMRFSKLDYEEYFNKYACFQIFSKLGNDFQRHYYTPDSLITRNLNGDVFDSGTNRQQEECPSYPSWPPPNWTLDHAVSFLKCRLTAEGLWVIDRITFSTHPHGCRNRDADNSVLGCYSYSNSKRGIYIRDDLFLQDYAEKSNGEKNKIIGRSLDTLSHEFFHATEKHMGFQLHLNLEDIIKACYEDIYSPSEDDGAWFDDSGYRSNYYEALSPAAEECLHNDPVFGDITMALKTLYQDRGDEVDNYNWKDESEKFSTNWYVEFYADTASSVEDLPDTLEDHYGRYMRGRGDLVQWINKEKEKGFFHALICKIRC